MTASSTADRDPESLLAQGDFVRVLARHLLRDAHGAEDVAQQTFVAALEAPPRAADATSRRAWLAEVVRRLVGRRRRGERRELERQSAAARPDFVPSTDEVVAREALRAEVVRAVLALDEPYRAVVLLRWFEHLPPRAIARRLQLPVETVRTRQKRALAMLRARLDRFGDGRGHAGRAAWCALLVPYGKGPGPVAAAALKATTIGVLLMNTNAKLVGAAALLGTLLLVGLWITRLPPAEPAIAGGAAEAAAPAVVDGVTAVPRAAADPTSAGGEVTQRQLAKGTAPEPVDAPSDAATLVVRVVFAGDMAPATDVVVGVERADGMVADEPRARTDAAGSVRFRGVAPGSVYPVVRRGGATFGDIVRLAAGTVATAELAIEEGMHCSGIVVDGDRRPIAGAEVLVADWGGGDVVLLGVTAADGTFAFRDVDTHCHVGARAAGYAASSLRRFTTSKGAKVACEIVLAEGAVELRGTVLDPHGRPVRGALVRAGDTDQRNHALPDGAQAMGARPDTVSTDAEGRFAFLHVAAGKTSLAVCAPGLAPWRDAVELQAGRSNAVTVRLEPGAVLAGTVRDGRGQPVAGAEIRVGGHDALAGRAARSGANGAFRVEGLAPGELAVHVESEPHGQLDATLQAAVGETVAFDPVLTTGLDLRGRVLDAEGRPAASTMIEAQREHPAGAPWWGFDNTDAEGRFALKNCAPGEPIRILVRRKGTFPELVLRHVVPSAEELVVRLPKEAWIHIRGTVLGPDGKPLPQVSASPMMRGHSSSPAETVDAATGAFRYGPYAPGEYSLRFAAAGYPTIRVPWRRVGPDEEWDTGTLRFAAGGTLRVGVVAADGGPLPQGYLRISDADGEFIEQLDMAAGVVTSSRLQPGVYSLQVGGDEVAAAHHAFEVRADVETVLDVRVQTGIRAVVECVLPAGSDADEGVDVLVRDEAGGVVLRGSAWRGEARPTLGSALRPGRYRVEASTAQCRGEAVLDVPASGKTLVRVVVSLVR